MHRLAYFVTAAVFAAVPVSVGLVVDPSLVEDVRVPGPRAAAPADPAAPALPEQPSTRRPSTFDEHRGSHRPHREPASAQRSRKTRVSVRHHAGRAGPHRAVELVSRVTPPSPAGTADGRDHVGVQPRRQPTSQGPGDDGRPQSDRGDEGGPGPSTRSGPSHPSSGSGDSGSGGSGSGDSGSGDPGSGGSGSGGSGSGGSGSGDSGSH